jgi:hypothetical protein
VTADFEAAVTSITWVENKNAVNQNSIFLFAPLIFAGTCFEIAFTNIFHRNARMPFGIGPSSRG